MASLLLNKADQMKQRLRRSLLAAGAGLSCSSAASTSAVVFSSGRAIDRHSPRPSKAPSSVPKPDDNNSSSSSTAKPKPKKKTTSSTSPASSSRFLLNSSRLQLEHQSDDDITILDSLPPPSFIDFFPDQQIIAESSTIDAAAKDDKQHRKQEQPAVIGTTRRSTSSCSISRSPRQQQQVVVLKVSLHCKGCAGKVKKHISKMEGVTAFDIDIATKKVTVMGDVTPLGVLNCVSKVKSAQFWPASSSSSPPRASAYF